MKVCCIALCVFVKNYVIYSFKRQTADMRLSELHAIREILNRLPTGCSQYACGLVDIFRRYRYACININTNACWEPVLRWLLHETEVRHCIRPIMVHEWRVTSIHLIFITYISFYIIQIWQEIMVRSANGRNKSSARFEEPGKCYSSRSLWPLQDVGSNVITVVCF